MFSGHVKSGLPTFQAPPFSAQVKNETHSFFDMMGTLGSGSFIVPLLAILENIAICKAFCK
jgi:sodium-independent sulfate anion transporter 11